jgi:OOP family OmpA-OmpF porin
MPNSRRKSRLWWARRSAIATSVAASALLVAGCGGSSETAQDATVSSTGGASSESGVALPPFPVPRVPDITTMTSASMEVRATIGAETELPVDVQVEGARCNAQGQVVNRSGLTTGAGDDGSQVVNRAGTIQRDVDGSGQVTNGTVTYQVNADGSGQIIASERVVQVNADGSGQYTDDDLVYQVDANGAGQYTRGSESYQVDADGAGLWSGPYGEVANSGDGSGSWVSGTTTLTIDGDGTGTLNGEPITVDPMPKFALMGTFPKLQTLKALGEPCGTLIRLPAGILFDFDKATLRPEAAPVLAAVAEALAGQTSTVEVNGHTDAVGDDAYNQDLSERRAQAVIAGLQSDGVSTPLRPQGFGETQPVAPNTLDGKDNPTGRQLNRRVEIVIPAP